MSLQDYFERYRISAIVLVLVLLSPCRGATEGLTELLERAQTGGSYLQVSKTETDEAEELFVRLFKKSERAIREQWDALQYTVIRYNDNGEDFVALMEKTDARRGRGFFVFRCRKTSSIVLQMPHSFRDLHTGDLGCKLFLEGRIQAAAWNTIPRNKGSGGTDSWVDLAHEDESYFTAFARAFARSYDKGGLIQIHGFSKNKRNTETGRQSDIIVSSGTILPSQAAWFLDSCWEQRCTVTVRLYPTEILELGGTGNATGRTLRTRDSNSFVHVELSKKTRERLLETAVMRRHFLDCVEEVFP